MIKVVHYLSQYRMKTNNYVKWDDDMFYMFVMLSKFCKKYRKNPLNSEKSYDESLSEDFTLTYLCRHVVIVTSVFKNKCITLILLDIDDL